MPRPDGGQLPTATTFVARRYRLPLSHQDNSAGLRLLAEHTKQHPAPDAELRRPRGSWFRRGCRTGRARGVVLPQTTASAARSQLFTQPYPGPSLLARAVHWTSQPQFRGPTIRSQPHPIKADASGPRGGARPRRDGIQRSAETGALARFAPHCRRRHRPGRPEDASVLRQERGARIGPHAAGVTARALARWRVGCGRPCSAVESNSIAL